MSIPKPYPHLRINVEDRSIFTPVSSDELPVHRPVYPMKTQRGPIGVPVWCPTIAKAREVFGAETFNVLNKQYFSQSSAYLLETFPYNGAFITRLVDAAAVESIAILEAAVTPANIVQYEKDVLGNIVYENGLPKPQTTQTPQLDGNGDPVLDGNGDPVFDTVNVEEAGVKVKWSVRNALVPAGGGTEDFDDLQIRTEDVSDGNGGTITVTHYPIMSFKATSSGAWGNDLGFKIWFDKDQNSLDIAERLDALVYNIAPVQKEFDASTVDPIRDITSAIYSSFVLKPDTIDSTTARSVSLDKIIEDNYADGVIPYHIDYYGNTILALGDAIRAVEVNRAVELSNGWRVNIFGLTDLEGKPYDHAQIDGDIKTSEFVVNYLAGGTDGDITDTAIESLYRNFLELDINPDIVDRARYPFTHVIDTGWSLETKYSICQFMAVRDDVDVVLATQRATDVGGVAKYNTALEDESLEVALRNEALLVPESVIKGTGACRAQVFTQAGKLFGLYDGIVPFNLWYAVKLAVHGNRNFMNGEPAGLPNSDVSLFREWNWAPAPESQRSRVWDKGGNYAQYYSRNEIHYPALRSVYRHDTSVLASANFVQAVVYTKHIVRTSWAIFAGVERDADTLHKQIVDDLTPRLNTLYNGKYNFTVSAYQTDLEKQLGYVHHVVVSIEGPGQNRVWDVDIICTRQNFEG